MRSSQRSQGLAVSRYFQRINPASPPKSRMSRASAPPRTNSSRVPKHAAGSTITCRKGVSSRRIAWTKRLHRLGGKPQPGCDCRARLAHPGSTALRRPATVPAPKRLAAHPNQTHRVAPGLYRAVPDRAQPPRVRQTLRKRLPGEARRQAAGVRRLRVGQNSAQFLLAHRASCCSRWEHPPTRPPVAW